MIERYHIGAYWPGRIEPFESFARRAELLFQQLAPCDLTLERWFMQANSRKMALKSQFQPDKKTLLELFAKKKYQLYPWWISFAAWNGEDEAGSVISFSCGSDSAHVVDYCLLMPPVQGVVAERVLSVPVLAQALRAMVLAWEPDWGVVTSNRHRDMVSESGEVGTFVGWIMYFSNSRGAVPPLPAPVRVEPVEDKGTLVILTPERLTASNPEHVALALQVQEILGQAGLLKPVQVSP
jgi:hypothetical protein